MKKFIIVAAALVWAGTASAKHERNNQRCYDCHTMHASISHKYTDGTQFNGNGTTTAFVGGASGYANLLMFDGVNATCLSCHDSQGGGTNTDVYGAGSATLDTKRSGGALNGMVPGKDAGVYADYMGHTLGSKNAPPGFANTGSPWPAATSGDEGLTCAKCHAVHGGATDAFRLLGGVADMGWDGLKYTSTNPFLTAYPTVDKTGAFNAAADVSTVTVAGVTSDRDARRIVYGKGNNGMNAYCGVCHGNFHGSTNTGATSNFRRHPTTGEAREAASWFSTGAQVGSKTEGGVVRPVWTADTKFEVGCLTCHKAHGNKRAFGLIWPTNAAPTATTNYEDGDGTSFQALCATCHVQARTTAGFSTFDNGVRQ